MRITADQALAWRLERQFLSPREQVSRAGIVRRLGGVQSQVASAAEASIATRQRDPGSTPPGNDTLIKTWAMRGPLHLCHGSQVANVLSLLAASRTWTKTSWQKTFGATPDELAATRPSRAVHLLGPFDAYVLGATTKDTWMLPAEHRDRVSRAAGRIAPVILSGGRVVGTWELEHGDVVTEFFPGEKVLSRRALAVEVARVTDN